MSPLTEQEIRNHAATFGIELSPGEVEYLVAAEQYDWWAKEPQMPFDVAQERGLAWQALKQSAQPERLAEIDRFFAWLQECGWCDHEYEIIWEEPGLSCQICMICGYQRIVGQPMENEKPIIKPCKHPINYQYRQYIHRLKKSCLCCRRCGKIIKVGR